MAGSGCGRTSGAPASRGRRLGRDPTQGLWGHLERCRPDRAGGLGSREWAEQGHRLSSASSSRGTVAALRALQSNQWGGSAPTSRPSTEDADCLPGSRETVGASPPRTTFPTPPQPVCPPHLTSPRSWAFVLEQTPRAELLSTPCIHRKPASTSGSHTTNLEGWHQLWGWGLKNVQGYRFHHRAAWTLDPGHL